MIDTDSTDAALWRPARTLNDLGRLTAGWLEGSITYLPADYGDGPEEETAPLISVLAEANRNGYVTVFSQPGLAFPGGDAQRAAVGGFCDENLARRIEAAVLRTDLIALVTRPGGDSPSRIPVTIDGGEPFTWIGNPLDSYEISHHYGRDCPHALDALTAAWQVEVFDPRWGREDVLWECLTTVWAQ
ncbi:hypothetical protein AB0942_09385 [Streptomyces nodosus]|uniref:DUF6919 domain-containing protein n=1 Tax=Streptomyces nodosus TaxID=40318 RepID=UPI0034517647